uniref:CCHC-type domain-containing protein n=1 Tax=Tanacetum cinerariifolium TaxID=118510 RepID=A0A699J3A5_TANCI|nr:hypothetical protein [Tanacetum cinerariifolium]
MQMIARALNNMPPKRTYAVVRAAAAAAPMTAAVVEQLIKARVSAALTNHEALRNSTNVLQISNCAVKNQVKFATCTFLGGALTWWNSHMKAVTQDVAYAMDWKTLRKMMTDKYCPRGKIKKLEIELWNLKVKDEVEKYVVGLPDMIRGNKRKMEFNVGNNQRYQQQNKRQNTGRAYTVRPGEKKEYTGSLPLCTKCNYHHQGPCAPKITQNAVTCYECGVQGHFKKDCLKLKNGNRGNLTNSTVEERFAFNVSLGMFTRSIVIQRRVEDLQLGVESYQKKLNLTRPDTCRSDLKRKEAYIAYSNPKGFIYQNKDKQNRLMRIDELHKFSDGTLPDVRTALDDRLQP